MIIKSIVYVFMMPAHSTPGKPYLYFNTYKQDDSETLVFLAEKEVEIDIPDPDAVAVQALRDSKVSLMAVCQAKLNVIDQKIESFLALPNGVTVPEAFDDIPF